MFPLLPHSINYVGGNSTLTHLTTGAIPRARKERTIAVISEHSRLTTSPPGNSSTIDVRMFLRTERVLTPHSGLKLRAAILVPSAVENTVQPPWQIEPRFLGRLTRRPVTILTELHLMQLLG